MTLEICPNCKCKTDALYPMVQEGGKWHGCLDGEPPNDRYCYDCCDYLEAHPEEPL